MVRSGLPGVHGVYEQGGIQKQTERQRDFAEDLTKYRAGRHGGAEIPLVRPCFLCRERLTVHGF